MSKRQLACNILGVFAYLSCLMQWLWLTIVWLPAIMNSDVQNFLIPSEPARQLPAATLDIPAPLALIITIVVTVVIMGITITVLLRLPKTIATTGKKVTEKSADLLLPAVTKHKPISKKRKLLLTVKLIKVIKLILVLLPLIAVLPAYTQTLPLDFSLVVFIGGILAITSLLWFTLQYILAHFLHVPAEKLV